MLEQWRGGPQTWKASEHLGEKDSQEMGTELSSENGRGQGKAFQAVTHTLKLLGDPTHVSGNGVVHHQFQKFIYNIKNRGKRKQRECLSKQGSRKPATQGGGLEAA